MSQVSAKKPKQKLMVVDDEPDNLDLLFRTFRRDFKVYKADSGFQALETLDREGEMAVIVTDQRMPGMNGTEFLSRTVDRFPDTVRIILTGYTDVDDLVGAINSGKVYRYITKPWSPDSLKSTVLAAADAYRVLKGRTNELNRALRQESLFNDMMSAIRGSLDYGSMMQTIADTLGRNFQTKRCLIQAAKDGRPVGGLVYGRSQTPQTPAIAGTEDQDTPEEKEPLPTVSPDNVEAVKAYAPLLHQVIQSQASQSKNSDEDSDEGTDKNSESILLVPLLYQQECLAAVCLVRDQEPWSQTDQAAIEQVAEQAALALSQARLYQTIQAQTEQLQSELEVARQVQGNLLRQHWPKVDGVAIEARCSPALQVGGDFFEVFSHPNGDVWLAVGDVSGKGVPAALFMASALSILRQQLAQATPPDPHVVVSQLNQGMMENLVDSNRFITLALARYTPATGALSYANAGHIYPMVWSQAAIAAGQPPAEPKYLKTRGVPLGILPVWKADSGMLTLEPGDALLLASDGITEAMVIGLEGEPPPSEADPKGTVSPDPSSGGEMLQQAGLWTLLQQQAQRPLSLDQLLSDLHRYEHNQEDDQTILSLEIL
ncbi:MAG: SpoIIE family protein phosphatase [Cyanobacteria bacterium P01_H01_bin.130]